MVVGSLTPTMTILHAAPVACNGAVNVRVEALIHRGYRFKRDGTNQLSGPHMNGTKIATSISQMSMFINNLHCKGSHQYDKREATCQPERFFKFYNFERHDVGRTG